MKTRIWKAFSDYEKEEKWLNEMAAKGMAMIDYRIYRYTFDECVPGEYIYRIELLEHGANHPESVRYIRFLEENGVEHIATYNSWIYLRKKAENGAFELYNDLDSRIKHYSRIARFWRTIFFVELFLFSWQTIMVVSSLISGGERFWIVNAVSATIIFMCFVLVLRLLRYYNKKIKRLRREREIFE
jgi:hypothetical protein